MKYCVIKNTTTIIDGSKNPIEVMYKNATSAGFSESEVEILTAEEYGARKALEPTEPKSPTIEEQLAEKDKQIIELNKMHSVTNQLVIENNAAQLDLLELLLELGVL